MKKLRLILFALLLAACGEPGAGDSFSNAHVGAELGLAQQGMATKFSSTYSHGVSTGATRSKCTLSLGGGVGQSCVLPYHGIVRFKLTGTDPRTEACGGGAMRSWKCLVRRAFNFDVPNAATVWGYGWPFGTAIEEDTAQTWVEVTNATCTGDVHSNNVWDYACIEWTGLVTVTESFTGTYKKCGAGCTVKIKIDAQKILDHVALYPGGGPDSWDEHEAMEHVVNGVIPAVYGSGNHLSGVSTGGLATWSSRYMQASGVYDVSGYTKGEGCRMGNWSSMGPDSFSALTGSCPDNW